MQTLTKSLTHQKITIPENIQNKVDDRWFYLYEWITPKEVKTSIERDYLKILSFIAFPLWIVSIFTVIFWIPIFLGVLWIAFLFISFYLLYISIKRSIILNHISNVIITNNAISVWWKIINNDNFVYQKSYIERWEKEFDEDLFWESQIWVQKDWFLSKVYENLINIWKYMMKFVTDISSDIRLILFANIVIAIYFLIVAWVYFVWIFFIWIFWLFIMIVNKAILKFTWHQVYYINWLFEDIDTSSNILLETKNNLTESLNNATQNKWQGWLLVDINSWIEKTNHEANNSIKNILKLKTILENSKYSEIFSFETYNNWIKRQIIEPLNEIKNLLEKNKGILENTIKELENQISITIDITLKNPLELQKTRLEKQNEDFEKYIVLIKSYIDKLK